MKKYTSTIAAFLLIIAAIVNIRCESEKQRQQAAFLQYIHENSKPYKQSLKMDSLFAEKLDISPLSEGTIDKVNKIVGRKPQNLYKKKK